MERTLLLRHRASIMKVDWCGGNKEDIDPAVQYAEIARAIAMADGPTGHTRYFSICDWGKQSP
jgi:hypothetical protein